MTRFLIICLFTLFSFQLHSQEIKCECYSESGVKGKTGIGGWTTITGINEQGEKENYGFYAAYFPPEELCIPRDNNWWQKVTESILEAVASHPTLIKSQEAISEDARWTKSSISIAGAAFITQNDIDRLRQNATTVIEVDASLVSYARPLKKCSEISDKSNVGSSSKLTTSTNSSNENSTSSSSSSTNANDNSSSTSTNNNQDSKVKDEARAAAIKAEQSRVEEQNKLREQMVTDVATTASKFAEGFSEGVFTDLRALVNFRLSEGVTDQDDNDRFTSMDMVTYDLGIGVGRSGYFSVGYGTPEIDTKEGSMYKFGLDFDVLSLVPTGGKPGRNGVILGIEGELGFGSTETVEENREDIETEDGTIYGGAVTLKLFEIFYAGIGYGFISSDVNGPDGESSLKGNYTNTIVGLNIPF